LHKVFRATAKIIKLLCSSVRTFHLAEQPTARMNSVLPILSVRDRASLIDVLNENQRMQQW
jgi:hypothetical protein